MDNFYTVVKGTDALAPEPARRVLAILGRLAEEQDGASTTTEECSRIIGRIPRDELLAVLMDWWLVVTFRADTPLGHAFNLPESVPPAIRNTLEGLIGLNRTDIPIPPAQWIARRDEYEASRPELDHHLELDFYGNSKLPPERNAWADLIAWMQPTIEALRNDQPSATFEFDTRDYERVLKEAGVTENTPRWREMTKRADACVEWVNNRVALQNLVQPWIERETPDRLDVIPESVTTALGPLSRMVLASVVTDEAAMTLPEPEFDDLAPVIADIAASMTESELSWLTELLGSWAERAGAGIPSVRESAHRRNAIRQEIESLRTEHIEGDDLIDAEILLLDHDISGAEGKVAEIRHNLAEARQKQAIANKLARITEEMHERGMLGDWQTEIDAAHLALSRGALSEAAQHLNRLETAGRDIRRADDLEQLEACLAGLRNFLAPDPVLSELQADFDRYSTEPDRRIDPDLVLRAKERLHALITQRRDEARTARDEARQALDVGRESIASDTLDELEVGISRIDRLLAEDEVMEARQAALDLRSAIDRNRVRAWHAEDGERSLLDHVIDFCTQELHFDRDDVIRLFVAAKTKPFVILAGLTGSGKSTIARLFAAALGADSRNGQFRRIAVKPDWIDQSEVLGTVNPLSNRFEPGWLATIARDCLRNADKLHVVLLDEMNLAPVEHYLAEYLSALEESRSGSDTTTLPLYPDGTKPANADQWPASLPFPENLIVIGTVNVDETTRVLSERVLDRANVLQLSVEISDAHHGRLTHAVQPWVVPFREWSRICVREPSPSHHDFLVDVARTLEAAGIGVGQRAHVELERFLANSAGLLEPVASLDLGLVQRIIPKIRGFKRDLEGTLIELTELLQARNCDRSTRILEHWLDERVPEDEFLDGTDARIGLIR